MTQELRILSPCGILGYGFPEESLLRGIEREPHVIAVDAGSTDAGPHKLGGGMGIVSAQATKRDLTLLMTHAYRRQIPLIIGSAGGAGARPHVEWTLRIVEEIAREARLSFDAAVIYSDVEPAYLRRKLAAGRVEALGPAPELTEESLAATRNIVAQMGSEPIIAHLQDLGITAVELLPVYQAIDARRLVDDGLVNYWGYDPISFFAPAARYALGAMGEQVHEFKWMVKALHEAGIEMPSPIRTVYHRVEPEQQNGLVAVLRDSQTQG